MRIKKPKRHGNAERCGGGLMKKTFLTFLAGFLICGSCFAQSTVNFDINASERDEQKILNAFNKTFGTKIDKDDIRRSSVLKQFEFDQKTEQQ